MRQLLWSHKEGKQYLLALRYISYNNEADLLPHETHFQIRMEEVNETGHYEHQFTVAWKEVKALFFSHVVVWT